MDEREKAQLNKQKKLLDCIRNLNYALGAFENFEEYSSQLLPIIDGFDLTASDTYLELTKDVRGEVVAIKFYAQSAARDLADYRQLCHPEPKIYSVKARKIRAQLDSQLISSQPNETDDGKSNSDRSTIQSRELRNTELRLLRLEWTILFLFLFQAAILIKVCRL